MIFALKCIILVFLILLLASWIFSAGSSGVRGGKRCGKSHEEDSKK